MERFEKVRARVCDPHHHLLIEAYAGDKIAFVHSDSKYDVSEVRGKQHSKDTDYLICF